MEYKIYRSARWEFFCIGIKMGNTVMYWNPKEKSFQNDATKCWELDEKEDEVIAEFCRKNIFKEFGVK